MPIPHLQSPRNGKQQPISPAVHRIDRQGYTRTQRAFFHERESVRLFRVHLGQEVPKSLCTIGPWKQREIGVTYLDSYASSATEYYIIFFGIIPPIPLDILRRGGGFLSAQAVPETGLCTIRGQRQLAFFLASSPSRGPHGNLHYR